MGFNVFNNKLILYSCYLSAIHIGHNIAIKTWSDRSSYWSLNHTLFVHGFVRWPLFNAIYEQHSTATPKDIIITVDCQLCIGSHIEFGVATVITYLRYEYQPNDVCWNLVHAKQSNRFFVFQSFQVSRTSIYSAISVKSNGWAIFKLFYFTIWYLLRQPVYVLSINLQPPFDKSCAIG